MTKPWEKPSPINEKRLVLMTAWTLKMVPKRFVGSAKRTKRSLLTAGGQSRGLTEMHSNKIPSELRSCTVGAHSSRKASSAETKVHALKGIVSGTQVASASASRQRYCMPTGNDLVLAIDRPRDMNGLSLICTHDMHKSPAMPQSRTLDMHHDTKNKGTGGGGGGCSGIVTVSLGRDGEGCVTCPCSGATDGGAVQRGPREQPRARVETNAFHNRLASTLGCFSSGLVDH